jgi:hypothetical protein
MTRYEALVKDASRVTIARVRGRATIEYRDQDIIRMYNAKKPVLNDLALACAQSGLWPMSSSTCSEVWVRRCATTK